MGWTVQAGLAAILAILGLVITFNPVSATSIAASIIPWMLIGSAGVYLLTILFRPRRRPLTIVFPAFAGALCLYLGLSMKVGDPRTAGPIPLAFLLALLLLGAGVAKFAMLTAIKRSRYRPFVLGSAALSTAMGLIVLASWQTVSPTLIGVVLGLELLADATVLVALALRDRDGEEALEAAGLDPMVEAQKRLAEAPSGPPTV